MNKPPGVDYAVRLGVATGLTVVGDLIGAGSAAEEKAVVGITPHLAARLRSVADPDQLVIGSTTESLVRGLFALTELGTRQLKESVTQCRSGAWMASTRVRAASKRVGRLG